MAQARIILTFDTERIWHQDLMVALENYLEKEEVQDDIDMRIEFDDDKPQFIPSVIPDEKHIRATIERSADDRFI